MSEENNPSVLFYSCLPTPEPIVQIRQFLKTNFRPDTVIYSLTYYSESLSFCTSIKVTNPLFLGRW